MLKICTIGGGSSYTPELIEGFINRYHELPIDEIWLHDILEGKEKLDIIVALAKRMIKKAGLPIKVYGTLDRRAAIKDATFVTTQIRVGFIDARIKDETISLTHGMLGQETNGSGGLFKALRTIPVIFSILDDVEELAPDAWVINFSNPAGIVTEAVHRYHTHKKFVGLCNVPYAVKSITSKMFDCDITDMEMIQAGLNHMSYSVLVTKNGEDVTKEAIHKMATTEITMNNIAATLFNKDFLKNLSVMPNPYHRYYYKRDTMIQNEIEDFKTKGETRGTNVKALEAELFKLYQDDNLDVKPPQLAKRGGAHYSDCACNLISSIYNDKGDVQVVNTVNNGAITCFENDEVVEVSSKITKDGPVPIHIGDMPLAVTGLLRQVKVFERLVSEAAYKKDFSIAYLALCVNPLSNDDDVSKACFDDLAKAHAAYLEGYEYR